MSIVSPFCEGDRFLLAYEKYASARQLSKTPEFRRETRGRSRGLHTNEVMTILVIDPRMNSGETSAKVKQKHL